MRVSCSTSTSRTPRPSCPSGARCSRAATAEIVTSLPGLARLLETLPRNGGAGERAAAVDGRARRGRAGEPDAELLGGVAAAMALVKAHRMHGHLAARLDPLGSEPVGDPALDPMRLEPKLTLELQARIPASVLRIHVAGETLAEALPRLQETYCGTIAYEIEHISTHEQRVWLRKAIESWRYRTAAHADEQRRALHAALPRSRRWSATCAARSSARSSSRSKGSTC